MVRVFDPIKKRCFLGLFSFLMACATGPGQKEVLQSEASAESTVFLDIKDSAQEHNPPIFILGKQLKTIKFDLSITINARVEYWVDYFCGRGRVYFEKYLLRSEYYIPYIQSLLKQNGMPGDLVYLAMIESGFNNLAHSHARAVGPWQFIAATGKRYGLSINWWVDERRDIQKSTLAAAAYLKDLYAMFQSWDLAAAAYNAGESKIARAIRQHQTKDYWMLVRYRFLKQETRDYVPKLIAAAIISKNREVFGFPPSQHIANEKTPPVVLPESSEKEEVPLRKLGEPTEGEEAINEETTETTETEELEAGYEERDRLQLTQELLSDPASELTPDQKALQKELAQAVEKSKGPESRLMVTPHLLKSGEVGEQHLVEIAVSEPVDLFKAAQLAKISYEEIKSFNPELRRWSTPPKTPLFRLKMPVEAEELFKKILVTQPQMLKAEFLPFNVRKGDTPSRIASVFGIKVDPIIDLNRLSKHTPLLKGSKVLLPVPLTGNFTFAQLEIKDPPEKRRRKKHMKRRHLRQAGSRLFKRSSFNE